MISHDIDRERERGGTYSWATPLGETEETGERASLKVFLFQGSKIVIGYQIVVHHIRAKLNSY